MLRSLRVVALATLCVASAFCSSGLTVEGPTAPSVGGGSETPPTPPTPPTSSTVVTVTAAGVSPQLLTVPVGSRVTFTNADNRPHDFSGGPDPSHPQCPEIDVAGFVAAGQSRQTGVFTTAQTCEYHDHTYIGVAAFQGRIIVQ